MIKKIFLPMLLLFMSFLAQGQITLTTTSTSGAWSPQLVTKTGDILTWTASSNADFPGQIVNLNDPVFDFSTNTNGLPIDIVVTSTDGFNGLTQLDLWNDDGLGSQVTDIDVSNATALTVFNMRYNLLSSLDVSANINLTSLIVRGNNQLSSGILDISNNTQLNFIQADQAEISSLDISNNTQLLDVKLYNMNLLSAELDQLVIDLDNHGLSNGNLEIRNQRTGKELTNASLSSYNSLISKGWNIDVPAPPVLNAQTIILTTTSTSIAWSPIAVVNSGATLKWSVSGGGVTIPEVVIDDPTFNLSANTGTVTITISSNEGFSGLTRLDLWNDDGLGSQITDIDVSNAAALTNFNMRYNLLSSIDVASNINLTSLTVRGNNQLSSGILDISNNTQLAFIQADQTEINSISLTNNSLLSNVKLYNMRLTSSTLDQLLLDLDNHGLTDGNIEIRNQLTGEELSSASFVAYNNLIAKNWTIDVPAPAPAPNPIINITGLGNTISGDGTNTPSTTDDTDFGQTASGTVITKTFTIENLGDQPLDLTGAELVAISGTNAADFTISTPPATPVAVGATTTFEVTFNASSLGVRTAILTIASNDPNDPSYFFNIQAESTQASGPEINVTGNGQSIPSGNTPIVADDTDFGQVAIGSPVTKTFTIENLGNSDLTVKSIGLYESTLGSGTGDYAITNGGIPSGGFPPGGDVIVGSGSTITFDVKFDPQSLGTQTVFVGIESDDSDEQYYFVNLTAEGIAESSGTIDVQGNGISIVNGDTTPDVTDDTDFGQVINNSTKTTTYTIYNNHATENLTINSITLGFGVSEFLIGTISETLPFDIIPGGNITFDVDFSPLSAGNYQTSVNIDNSENSQNPFQYNIAGEGADVVVVGDIMITQYYSSSIVNDKWIEIKNISGTSIPAGTYFLALYDESDIPNITSISPTASEPIPALATDEVLLFKNPLASLPNNLGSATQISTNVCSFDGNDVILISRTDDNTSYGNRQDIIGTVPVTAWGQFRSYIKGGCASESGHADYLESDWTILSIADVNNANSMTNLALGTQVVGPTLFNGSTWSNLLPDQSRTVIITNSFSGANQTIVACNLTINPGVNVTFNSNGVTSNSIVIHGDLIVDGSLTIGDTESLLTVDGNATLGVITKIENSIPLFDIHDNTYWSSPIKNAQIGTIFSGVDPNRIFQYNQSNTSVTDLNDPAFYNVWEIASGPMAPARGYAAEGPSTGVHSISFTGIPNNGNIDVGVFYWDDGTPGDPDNDFNLIGNPYPTAIDIQRFFDTNGGVADVYLWTHSTPVSGGSFTQADYVLVNRSGSPDGVTNNIGSSQGFMVRVSSDIGFAQFNNSMKIADQNTQFYKSINSKKEDVVKDSKDRLWLKISGNKNLFSNILIAFSDEATDDFDWGYDSYGLNINKKLLFYSQLDNKKLVIQSLSEFSDEKVIPMGFDTRESGQFTISEFKSEGILKDIDIYLVDNLLGKTHNLKEGAYTFEQKSTGEFKDRFSLQFKGQALDVDDEIFAKNEFVISNDYDSFKISSTKVVKDLKVYDLLGRMIIQKQPNKKSFNINTTSIKNGTVLVIKATLDNGSVVSKKTIKY